MNKTVKRILQSTGPTKMLYSALRGRYRTRQQTSVAAGYFINPNDFRRVLAQKGSADIRLRAKDGLLIDVRPNYMDASILCEVLIERCYADGLKLSPNPVVIDIGGYIGDFVLYSCKYLDAARVITCEPSSSNLRLLRQNVALNEYSDRVTIIPKAVTSGGDVMIDTDVPERGQARVSAYYKTKNKPQRIPGITLDAIVKENAISHIDLLKIDCEGGEYDIIATMSPEVLAMVDNFAFEYHEIEGYEAKLQAAKDRLAANGFRIHTKGDLVFAVRG